MKTKTTLIPISSDVKIALNLCKVLIEVQEERTKQDLKWGEQNHPCLNQELLTRVEGCKPPRMCAHYEIPREERAKYLCERAFEKGYGTYAHIAIEELSEAISQYDPVKRREELIQLAAVCVAWIEKIDRDLNQVT
jgi:hypothetical protein